ncbi:putative myb DNA-binding domain-containing protein [Rosellinia necatrix]|uniref:Putative myb DNA-binding domain-containing protein n=1 Tax=Rosellinia necatrix TaxID=77044 RepID=A0A1S7UNN3_ROSNE|nr:putative myb DNA-binding domain-containing protein [Rosellinia necatrix]
MSQPHVPMLINIPPASSNPDTPSDIPGTPTSNTTSLSALSTTAIKDGHRGHAHLALGGPKGHGHHPSTNSLEAERADRISRLAGLERVSTIRAPNQQQGGDAGSPQTTPTSTGFPAHNTPAAMAPAYFDANGQPTAATKMSTVGTASATASIGARTTTEPGERFEADLTEIDEDELSTDTNYRHMDLDSTSGAIDPMDEDLANRSVGGFEDRMSDDGTASLVGFGEGANSTVSGPIYIRKQHHIAAGPGGIWGLERSSSGLSQEAMLRHREMRDVPSSDTPVSSTAAAERREAKYVDGVAMDGGGHVGTADDDMFVDTTTRGPVPIQPGQHQTSALREGVGGPATREAAERIVRERLEQGSEGRGPVLTSPQGGEKLGKFYFEEKK